MLRVNRCWVSNELDVATVRDDHHAVVVDVETMLCFPRAGSQHRKAKLHREDATFGVQKSLSTGPGENSGGNSWHSC